MAILGRAKVWEKCRFLLWHSPSRARIWLKTHKHESILFCISASGYCWWFNGGGDISWHIWGFIKLCLKHQPTPVLMQTINSCWDSFSVYWWLTSSQISKCINVKYFKMQKLYCKDPDFSLLISYFENRLNRSDFLQKIF